MKFKKIYIEITNICNLNCSFCKKSNRSKREMTKEEFEIVLKKINNYTDYIYLHVKGEPLTYKYLDDILFLTKKYNKRVCITTNGILLKDKLDILKKYDNVYQINISLHSENNKKDYLDQIFDSADYLSSYISYRFWTLEEGKMDKKMKEYLLRIKDKYQKEELYDGVKLKDKVYLSLDSRFVWPSLDNEYVKESGYCYGGKSHIAILSDGTVSICCLDDDGISNLGNIFTDDLENILSSSKYQSIVEGFKKRCAHLDICKHCSYKERFDRK